MDAYFFKLYWKNIWRNGRRTTLTAGAIGLGIMALVYIHNYYDAVHEQLVGNVIRYSSGHLVVSAPDYQKQHLPTLLVKNPTPVEAWLEARPEVKTWGERALVGGMASSARGSASLLFMGVAPEREPKTEPLGLENRWTPSGTKNTCPRPCSSPSSRPRHGERRLSSGNSHRRR